MHLICVTKKGFTHSSTPLPHGFTFQAQYMSQSLFTRILEIEAGRLRAKLFILAAKVIHALNPNNWAAEAGRSLWVRGQPGLGSEDPNNSVTFIHPPSTWPSPISPGPLFSMEPGHLDVEFREQWRLFLRLSLTGDGFSLARNFMTRLLNGP